jgi:WhiB family redox-sensing transcriptional regulator
MSTWHMPWVEEALCAQTDPEMFFPKKGASNTAAKKICKQCPVTDDCLDWALRHHEVGVWGGMSAYQRKAERRKLGIRLDSGWTALQNRAAG